MNSTAIARTLTEDEFIAMRDSDEMSGALTRYVDSVKGDTYSGWVAIDRDIYIEGPKKSGLGWFGTAYEERAESTGVRVKCHVMFVGTPGTESRIPVVRCDATDVATIVAIAERADEMSHA